MYTQNSSEIIGPYSLLTKLLFLDMVYFITHLPSAPYPPHTPSSTVQQYGRDNVTLTVQWQPPQYDGGAPVNYTITVSPGLSPVTTSETSIPVTVPYNVMHTVSIVSTNCIGNSSASMEAIRIGICPYVNCMYACVQAQQVTVYSQKYWKLNSSIFYAHYLVVNILYSHSADTRKYRIIEQDNLTMKWNMHVQSMQAMPLHQDQCMSGNHITLLSAKILDGGNSLTYLIMPHIQV